MRECRGNMRAASDNGADPRETLRARRTWTTDVVINLSSEESMTTLNQHNLSRRGFCLCCMAASTFAATGGWLSPSQAYAEARNIVDLIRDDAAKAPIKVHRLRGDVSILEGSGGNIAVLTGADGKVFIDAGITASRQRILEAANGDPDRSLLVGEDPDPESLDTCPQILWSRAYGQRYIRHHPGSRYSSYRRYLLEWRLSVHRLLDRRKH